MDAIKSTLSTTSKVSKHGFDIPKYVHFLGKQIVSEPVDRQFYPFMIAGKEYDYLPNDGIHTLRNRNCKVLWDSTCEKDLYRINAEKRISNIFCEGFDNIVYNQLDEKPFTSGGCCHHLVNYISFGITHSNALSSSEWTNWFNDIPFATTFDYKEADLDWGDIVQLLFKDEKGEEVSHSALYIGDSRYINKHGWVSPIWFQELSGVQQIYKYHRQLRILKINDRNTSQLIPWKLKY